MSETLVPILPHHSLYNEAEQLSSLVSPVVMRGDKEKGLLYLLIPHQKL